MALFIELKPIRNRTPQAIGQCGTINRNQMNENLPEGWVEVPLKDVGSYINGRAFKSTEWSTKGLPIVRIQNLNNSKAQYNYSQGEYEEKFLVRNGDLLMSWSGTLNAYIWKGDEAWLNQHIFKVEANEKVITKKFLYYSLLFSIEDFYEKTHGSGLVHITKHEFENHKIFLPPLAEQNRIVEKLDELMSKVQAAQEQLNLIPTILKRFRQGVLSAAVSGKLTEDWRDENLEVEDTKRLLERVKLDRLKNDKNLIEKAKIEQIFNYVEEGNHFEIPHSWSFIRLSKLCYSFDYGTSKKSDNDEGEIPVLRMGNLQNGKIDWNNLKYSSDSSDIKKYLLKKGDVLFNRTNSPELVGKTAIYRGERPAIFAGYLVRINTSFGINTEYLNFVLNSNYARSWCLEVKSDGVSQSNISAQKLSEFELPLCPLEEQEVIIKRVENMFKWADELEGKYLSTKKYIDSIPQILLVKAFSGEISEQKPDDEPVTLLLERIKAEREVERQKSTEKKTRKSNKDMESKKSVIEIVSQEFGQNAFTFDELRKHTSKPYEEIKAELYTMLQAAESAVDYITMSFNSDTETMTFQLKNHAN